MGKVKASRREQYFTSVPIFFQTLLCAHPRNAEQVYRYCTAQEHYAADGFIVTKKLFTQFDIYV